MFMHDVPWSGPSYLDLKDRVLQLEAETAKLKADNYDLVRQLENARAKESLSEQLLAAVTSNLTAETERIKSENTVLTKKLAVALLHADTASIEAVTAVPGTPWTPASSSSDQVVASSSLPAAGPHTTAE